MMFPGPYMVDAYSGVRVPTVLSSGPDGLRMSAPAATSPRAFRPAGAPFPDVCPYTGERLLRVDVEGEEMSTGGFDPCRPLPAAEFARVVGLPAPPDGPRVEWVEPPAPMARGHEVGVSQEAIDVMKEFTEGARR